MCRCWRGSLTALPRRVPAAFSLGSLLSPLAATQRAGPARPSGGAAALRALSGGGGEAKVGGEGDATALVVGGDASAKAEVVTEEEKGGVGNGVDGVGEVTVVGKADEGGGGVADLRESFSPPRGAELQRSPLRSLPLRRSSPCLRCACTMYIHVICMHVWCACDVHTCDVHAGVVRM